MSHRRLNALRALAERPGTPEEGKVARAMLEKYESASRFEPLAFDGAFLGAFLARMRREYPIYCACGHTVDVGKKCDNLRQHANIHAQIQAKFKAGDRVYYNRWAYPINCPAIVRGYGQLWARIRLQFDHLKTVRSVPIFSAAGWHLSHVPLSESDAERMRKV